MKRIIISSVAIIFLITMCFFAIAGLTGCFNQAQQTLPTISTAMESTTAETTIPPIPATVETVAGEKIPSNFELVYVPKVDVPWFQVIKKGIEKCAEDYGFKVTVTAPPKLDPAIQAQIVLDLIGKTADAVIVCPVEEESMDTALENANAAGIMTFSNEGNTLKNISYDFESISNESFGQTIMQSGIKYTGGSGNYVVSVGFLNSAVHKAWADAEIAFQQENAPGMVNILGYSEGTDRFEDSEDAELAATKVSEIISANADLKLIIGNSMTTGFAAGEAIAKNRLQGILFYIGTGLPITVGEYIKDDIIQEAFFWDPYLTGYALGYMALKAWEGNPLTAGDAVVQPNGTILPGYESVTSGSNSAGSNVIAGNATEVITKENLEIWYTKFEEYGWPQY